MLCRAKDTKTAEQNVEIDLRATTRRSKNGKTINETLNGYNKWNNGSNEEFPIRNDNKSWITVQPNQSFLYPSVLIIDFMLARRLPLRRLVFWCSHWSPEYNPSPVIAQVSWTIHDRSVSDSRSSTLVISLTLILWGRSCLFAKMRRGTFDSKRSCFSMVDSSSLTSVSRVGSLLSITNMTASVSW